MSDHLFLVVFDIGRLMNKILRVAQGSFCVHPIAIAVKFINHCGIKGYPKQIDIALVIDIGREKGG